MLHISMNARWRMSLSKYGGRKSLLSISSFILNLCSFAKSYHSVTYCQEVTHGAMNQLPTPQKPELLKWTFDSATSPLWEGQLFHIPYTKGHVYTDLNARVIHCRAVFKLETKLFNVNNLWWDERITEIQTGCMFK